METGWGNNKDEPYRFTCTAHVDDGKILDIEPCFRGHSVLAPSAEEDDSQDEIDLHEKAVPDVGEQNGDGDLAGDGDQAGNEAGERMEK